MYFYLEKWPPAIKKFHYRWRQFRSGRGNRIQFSNPVNLVCRIYSFFEQFRFFLFYFLLLTTSTTAYIHDCTYFRQFPFLQVLLGLVESSCCPSNCYTQFIPSSFIYMWKKYIHTFIVHTVVQDIYSIYVPMYSSTVEYKVEGAHEFSLLLYFANCKKQRTQGDCGCRGVMK